MKKLIVGAVVAVTLVVSSCNSCSPDSRENELLRKEAELATKEAELAKKELELSKQANNSNAANAAVAEPPSNPEPIAARRIRMPSDLRAFTENRAAEVLAVDLNNDGEDEYIGIAAPGCGSGGCNLGIFQRTAKGFKNILNEDDAFPSPDPAPPPSTTWKPDYRFVAGPQVSKGHLDVVLIWTKRKSERYRFNGNEYRFAK